MNQKNSEQGEEKEEINQDIIDLVIARLETIPSNTMVSIGNEGSFEIQDLIKRVRANDEIGQKMLKIQLEYLRALKNLSQPEDVAVNY